MLSVHILAHEDANNRALSTVMIYAYKYFQIYYVTWRNITCTVAYTQLRMVIAFYT